MITKICSNKENCLHQDGPELNMSEFHKDRSKSNELQRRCKICVDDYKEQLLGSHF